MTEANEDSEAALEAAQEATMNANLAEAMGVSSEEVAEATQEAAQGHEAESEDSDAESAPVGSLGEEPLVDDDDDEDQPEADAKGEGDSIPYGERNEIRSALSKDGLPEALIESLSPSDLRAYWAKRQERDAAFSGMKSDLRRFKDKPADDGPKDDSDAAPTTEPDKSISTADLAAITEELGEEAATSIATYLAAQASKNKEEMQRTLAPLVAHLEGMIDTQQQSRLSGAVPEGHDEDWFSNVRTRAIEFGKTAMFEEMPMQQRQDALFDASLRTLYPDLPSPAEIKRKDVRAAQRRNGTSTRPGRNARKAKPTMDERTDMRAQAAVDGKTVAEINAMFDS